MVKSDKESNSRKIIINTGVAYASLLIMMVLSFFTTRLILQALGEVDYGILVLVAGIVAMLDILGSNMTNTSMRYLAHSLGNKNGDEVYTTFNSTIVIHYLIGFVSVAILEVGGIIMFGYIVNIPVDRLYVAKIIYQLMIVSTFISIISVPYDAVTNAHEKIWFLSICNVLSNVLKLLLVIFLFLGGGDRLVVYVAGLLVISVFMRAIKIVYAKRHFAECRKFQMSFTNHKRIREILSFTGWNLFGSIAALGAGQFRSLIINNFFGVKLNAAEGVSGQIGKPLTMFVTSMTKAITPQIMKSEGGDDRKRMHYLVEMGAKYSTFLFAMLGIPTLIEIPYILDIWLDTVPNYADIFCRITIFCMLLEKLTFQISHAISAVGKIRNYQVASSIGNLIYLPIAFVLFKIGYPPVTIYWLSIISILLNAVFRFYYGKTIAEISPTDYIREVIIPILFPVSVAAGVAVVVSNILPYGFCNLLVVTVTFCVLLVFLFWIWGMKKQERARWKDIIRKIFLKYKLL